MREVRRSESAVSNRRDFLQAGALSISALACCGSGPGPEDVPQPIRVPSVDPEILQGRQQGLLEWLRVRVLTVAPLLDLEGHGHDQRSEERGETDRVGDLDALAREFVQSIERLEEERFAGAGRAAAKRLGQ